MKLRRKLLKMPQHQWDRIVSAVRTNGLLALAAIVAAAIVTRASLIAIAQDPGGSELLSHWVWLGMRVLLTLGIFAVGAVVLAIEILGLRRANRG